MGSALGDDGVDISARAGGAGSSRPKYSGNTLNQVRRREPTVSAASRTGAGGRADAFRNLRQNFDAAKYDRGEFLRKGSDLSDSLQQSIDAGARRYGPRRKRPANTTRLFNWNAFITEYERLKRELDTIM